MATTVFLTGATGLIGGGVLGALLSDAEVERVYVLVRSMHAGDAMRAFGNRIAPVVGELRQPALGLGAAECDRLRSDVDTVVHAAATTSFSQTLEEARATNLVGTRNLLDVAADWRVRRWVHVSTAFVAGRRMGLIRESDPAASDGWLNGYEQSKAETEFVLRRARPDAVIVRPSTIVCDDTSGRITQVNSVHRALRLYFRGLAAMIPGADDTRLDAVPADYVSRAIATIATSASTAAGGTYHLCAGERAMPLDELLDVTHEVFAEVPAWRRRGIARPLRVDLPTYRLFESAVEAAGSARVIQAVRSLGYFIPQLAYPKQFATSDADRLLGTTAPAVRSYWRAMVTALAGGINAEDAAAA